MREVITQTYFIALPILLGYMVWLLQEQKKKANTIRKGT